MNNIKKLLVIAIVLSMAMVATCAFTACQDSSKGTIGIIQFGTHESLNDCYNGIILGLKEELGDDFNNYKIELQNSNFDPSASGAQANEFVGKNVSLIGAIATPSAMAAASAAQDAQIPVVYCAVSDPKSAGLTTMENVTGTSDLLDYASQLALFKAFIPTVDKIGVLYTTTEANSAAQLAELERHASELGIEIVSKSITNANEIPSATDVLLTEEGLDCITNLTDNTVVGALDVILEKTNALNIPVFGSEIDQVKAGCLASASVDYVALGKTTGIMMAKILKGEITATNDEAKQIEESFNCYNSSVASTLGFTVPSIAGRDIAE